MNLLEHYITEVISEKVSEKTGFIEAHFIVNCWGAKEEKKRTFSVAAWEALKEKGYYLG